MCVTATVLLRRSPDFSIFLPKYKACLGTIAPLLFYVFYIERDKLDINQICFIHDLKITNWAIFCWCILNRFDSSRHVFDSISSFLSVTVVLIHITILTGTSSKSIFIATSIYGPLGAGTGPWGARGLALAKAWYLQLLTLRFDSFLTPVLIWLYSIVYCCVVYFLLVFSGGEIWSCCAKAFPAKILHSPLLDIFRPVWHRFIYIDLFPSVVSPHLQGVMVLLVSNIYFWQLNYGGAVWLSITKLSFFMQTLCGMKRKLSLNLCKKWFKQPSDFVFGYLALLRKEK